MLLFERLGCHDEAASMALSAARPAATSGATSQLNLSRDKGRLWSNVFANALAAQNFEVRHLRQRESLIVVFKRWPLMRQVATVSHAAGRILRHPCQPSAPDADGLLA
jgi:hypothetical protein